MSDLPDRIAKGMVRAINNAPFDPSQTPLQREMNALLSHGLREAVEKAEEGAIDDSYSGRRCQQILTALLGEGETSKVCSECGAPWKTCECLVLRDSENSAVPILKPEEQAE